MSPLNETQRQLIQQLQRDGRQTSSALAARLGISLSTAQRMINRLIQDGIFRIVAVVDPVKVGLPIAAAVGFDVDPEKWQPTIEKLTQHPSVNMVSKITGPFDLLVFSRFKSLDDLSRFLETVLATTEGIRRSETFICFNVLKGRYTALHPSDIDSPQRDLIALLQQDGRQSTETMAAELGISPSTVQRGIRKLLQDGTIRIMAVVNPQKIDQTLAVAIGIHAEPKKWDEVARELAHQPMVRFVSKTTGRYDILAFMRFSSTKELSKYLEKLPAEIAGVRNSETLFCLEVNYGTMYQGWPYITR